jgi:glycosyltransferase involved in cell wall biosynthesis
VISVVIPAYNAGETIGDQLGAIAEGVAEGVAEGDVEVIVADNGSTDETRAIAEQWADRLAIRVVVTSQRRGPAAARNIGAAAAHGDLLVFTDADDVVFPGWLSAWRALDPDTQFATGPVVFFDADASPPRSMTDPASRPPVHLGFLPYALGTNFAIRRRTFLDSGGFPETRRTAEDVALSWQLQLGGVELCFEPQAGVAKRRARGSRAVLRQYYQYGWSDPFLVREFEPNGLRLPPPGSTLKSYLGIVARLPLLFDARQRERWCAQAGRRAGRMVGSIRARSFCP